MKKFIPLLALCAGFSISLHSVAEPIPAEAPRTFGSMDERSTPESSILASKNGSFEDLSRPAALPNSQSTFFDSPVFKIDMRSPKKRGLLSQKTFTPPEDALRSSEAAAQIAAVMSDLEFSKRCSMFATRNGFGKWGNVVIDELLRGRGNALLEGTDDLRRACPRFDDLGAREKAYVWVKIFAAMASLESSCDPKVTFAGPDGEAYGLLQLHRDHEDSAATGCHKRDSYSPAASLRCGISIIDAQIVRTRQLFSRDTHFGVLRPQGDLVQTKAGARRVVYARTVVGALRELPICQRN